VGDTDVRPGDVVRAAVTYAAPHHLVADGGITEHRPWRGYLADQAEPAPAGRALLPLAVRH
jgi:tRNA-2-methylthio-N6-dimethylallyladenosine synthase